jgi:hypothetical protein
MTVCSAGVTIRYQTCKQDIFNIRYVSPQTIAHHFSFAKNFGAYMYHLLPFFIHRDILVDFTFKGH